MSNPQKPVSEMRLLPRMGRPPIDDATINRAEELIRRGASQREAARMVGLSQSAVSRRLKGKGLNARKPRRYGKTMMDVLLSAVPKSLPEDVREEICQELALEILNGSDVLRLLRERAIQLGKRINREYHNRFQMTSLSTPINENGKTLGEILEG